MLDSGATDPVDPTAIGGPMIVECLTNAVISALMLLMHTEQPEIDRDTAMRGIEHIAYELNKMTEANRRTFRETLERLAEAEPDDAPFILDIPRMLGWDLDNGQART
jgi:hypothetical protein